MRRRTVAVDVVDLGDLDPLRVRRALVLEAGGIPGDHVEALALELGVSELELRAWLVAHDARGYGLDVETEVAELLEKARPCDA
jgi:hypothetical protein